MTIVSNRIARLTDNTVRQLNLCCALLVWLINKGLLLTLPVLAVTLFFDTAAPPSAAKYLTVCVAAIPAHLLSLGIVWAYVTGAGRRPFWRALGWDWGTYSAFTPTRWQGLAMSVLLSVGTLGFASFVAGFFANQGETIFDSVVQRSIYVRMMIALLSVASAPLVEEAVYRGVLYPALRRSVGVVAATLLVSLLFAAVHVGQYNLTTGMPNWAVITKVAMVGLCLTLMRATTGRLLPCVVMHATCNALTSLRYDLLPILHHFFG
jgi:membrane protease YdiL (CAAX protease family)